MGPLRVEEERFFSMETNIHLNSTILSMTEIVSSKGSFGDLFLADFFKCIGSLNVCEI